MLVDFSNRSFSQPQQQMQVAEIQANEIRMTKNLSSVKGTSEKLQRILKTHKIIFIFCTEKFFRKLLCKPKDQVATDDKNIIYEIGFCICEAIYFGESTHSLKLRSDIHKMRKRSVENYKGENIRIARHY